MALAAEKPELFNAYQQFQGGNLVKAMCNAKYIASFIRHDSGKALFIGMYLVGAHSSVPWKEFWQLPNITQLRKVGMKGPEQSESQSEYHCFDLNDANVYSQWKGRLIIGWPFLEKAWWRWADRNDFPILAILEDSILDRAMPDCRELILSWAELQAIPEHWKIRLAEWRGIYNIFDCSDGKGYVGSAYGIENLWHRWREYAASGHGDNTLLKQRDPVNFRFSILQLVSKDTEPERVIQLEGTWKERLHTRAPHGLNAN